MASQGSAGGDRGYPSERLEGALVGDAMRHELFTCAGDAPLREAARVMSSERVHMIVVTSPVDGSVVGTLGDLALLSSLLEDGDASRPVEELADRDTATVSSDTSLRDAARSMRERALTHLLVRDAHNGHPVGVLSALDIVAILAEDPG
jgi:CBS domain-containing protein